MLIISYLYLSIHDLLVFLAINSDNILWINKTMRPTMDYTACITAYGRRKINLRRGYTVLRDPVV
jgi:hypothetical protein